MQAHREDFRAAGAEMIAISSSSVEDHRAVALKIGATFPILSDPEGSAIRAFGLLHPDALPGAGFPVSRPAEFILDDEGVIRTRFLAKNWRIRERAERLLEEVRAVDSPSAKGR